MMNYPRRGRGIIRRRGKHSYKKFLTQVIICIIVVITVIIIKKTNSTVTNKIFTMVQTSITREMDIKDIAQKAVNGVKTVGSMPRNIADKFFKESHKYAFISPVDEGSVISTFGNNYNQVEEKSSFQRGVDYISEGEIQVHASEDGIVTSISESSNYGKYIKINHDETVFSIYSNCTNVYVDEGQTVKKGDILASTNSAGDGDNWFHFELWMDGEIVDPSEYIKLN